MTPLARRVALLLIPVLAGALAAPVSAEDRTAQTTSAGSTAPAKVTDRWAALRGFLGTWKGTSRGSPGSGTVEREYRLVLKDRFIEVRNRRTYRQTKRTRPGRPTRTSGT